MYISIWYIRTLHSTFQPEKKKQLQQHEMDLKATEWLDIWKPKSWKCRSSQHQNSLLFLQAESINPLTVQLFMSHVARFSRQMWHLVHKTEVHMREVRILHAHRRPPSPCSTAAHTPSFRYEWRVANPCNHPKVSWGNRCHEEKKKLDKNQPRSLNDMSFNPRWAVPKGLQRILKVSKGHVHSLKPA